MVMQVETANKPFYLKKYQAEFVATNAKFPSIISAWGTGKDLSALARVMRLCEYPDNLILILRKEFKDLQDSTIFDFESYTGLKVNSNGDCIVPSSDPRRPSKIMFRHIEQLNNLQNINLGAFWINQAEELNGPEPFFLLMGRLRRGVAFRTGFITANADGHNWCYNTWLETRTDKNDIGHKGEADYPCWQATTYDNADVLPPDYVASLKNLPDRLYKRFVMNDHSVAEGLVWPEFDEKTHTCNSFEIPSDWKETLSLDHGFAHPTVVLFGACDFDGNVIIYDEHYESGQLASYHAARIKEIEPEFDLMRRIIDPSCRNKTMQKNGTIYSIIDEYNDYGIGFETGQNDWDAGVNRVGEYFKTNRIKIFSDKCPNLIREIKNYKRKKQLAGQEKTDERPIKLNDDACDALRYLLMSRPQLTLKKIPRSIDPAIPLAYELLSRERVSEYDRWMK